MKTKKWLLVLLCIGFVHVGFALDWGKTGHRAVGEIAEKYLSRKAKKKLHKLLNGHSLAFVSNYADEVKSDTTFRKYGPWHYVNYPFNTTYQKHPKSEVGDIIKAINTCKSKLKDKTLPIQEQRFYLKFLVHLIGDLHQPMHIGLAKDKGGNTFQVQWFKRSTNLHKVWDAHMLDEYGMSYTELASNTVKLSKLQTKGLQQGSTALWAEESRELCKKIYNTTKVGENLSYRYMYDYMETLRFQLQKGGIRLAAVLNEIYG